MMNTTGFESVDRRLRRGARDHGVLMVLAGEPDLVRDFSLAMAAHVSARACSVVVFSLGSPATATFERRYTKRNGELGPGLVFLNDQWHSVAAVRACTRDVAAVAPSLRLVVVDGLPTTSATGPAPAAGDATALYGLRNAAWQLPRGATVVVNMELRGHALLRPCSAGLQALAPAVDASADLILMLERLPPFGAATIVQVGIVKHKGSDLHLLLSYDQKSGRFSEPR